MIYLRADGHKATITKDLPITTGSVGLQVEVSLSEDFDGLASVVTFRAGTVVADVAYVGELVEVPPQVMTKPNTALLIGVYAQSADGRTVIPTVWDNAGIIQPGTLPDDFPQPDPAPSWAAQVQLWAQEAHETAEALAEDVSEWGVAEDGRVAAEQSRVTAESARAQAESRRASAETARVNAETARAEAETAREDAESVRSSLEALRVQAESEREGAESTRAEAESSRATAESARASAETARASAESGRASAESQRVTAETARVSAEQVRATAEEARVLAEQGRASAETVRASSEQARQSAETAREIAEGARVQAESQRAGNEVLRVSAEVSRASAWATMQQEIESATEGAESVDATVTKSGTTATISVTDRTGTTHTATVSDGPDGYSPTVSVSPITGGHEVTITDAQGDHSFSVMDGDPAAPGSITDEMLAPDGIKPQVAQLFGNQLTGTLSGTIDTASDAFAAPPMALTVEGASTQVTTTGKNLFDQNKTPRGYHNNSGEFVSSNNYVWWSVPVSEGDIIRYANCQYCTMTQWSNGVYVGNSPQTAAATYTVPAGVDEIRGYSGTGTLDTAIVTLNNADLTYEPYTGGKPSPNPDYPQPIRSVDDLSLKAHGKNLLSTDLIEQGAIAADQTDKSSQNRCRVAASYNLDALAGNTVTCSGTVNGEALQYALSGYDGGVRVSSNWINSGSSYNIPAGRKKNRILFRRSDDANISPADFSNVQLELGSTATAYEPYQGTTVTLPVTLRSMPDGTRDQLNLAYLRPSTREGWAWYSREVTRGVGHVADMGELTWNLNSTNGYFTARIDDMNQTTTSRLEGLLCTAYGMSSTSGLTPTSPEDKKMMRYGGMIVIRDSSYSTAADFKAALDASLSYQLANSVITTLDPIELPTLHAPNATVWCDGGSAQPTFVMEYVQDTNIVIADLMAALADLATS